MNKNSKNTKQSRAIDTAAKAQLAKDKLEAKAAIEATKQQLAQQSSTAQQLSPAEKAQAKADLSAALSGESSPAVSPASPVVVVSESKGKLGAIHGCSVISVMRQMGRSGWSFACIRASISALGITAAERTIRGAIRRGRNPNYLGRVAVLSPELLASLKIETTAAPVVIGVQQSQAA